MKVLFVCKNNQFRSQMAASLYNKMTGTDNASIVVSMAEEPFVPDFLRDSKKVAWWKIENPIFVTRDVAEKTYSQIKKWLNDLFCTMMI